jgi:surfeit locus 1 family protein
MTAKRALATVGTGLLVTAFVGLGFWQLSRLEEKRAANRTLLARGELPVEDVSAVLGAPSEAVFRRVRATGTYDVAREVVLVSQSYRDVSGAHVVTPLRLADGSAILVDRGWVPLTFAEPPVTEAAPPAGGVVVTGRLAPTQLRGRFGPVETGAGPYEQVLRVDIDRLRAQFPYSLAPLFIQLESQEPPQPDRDPTPVPFERLPEGPHLAYAIQWFLFAAGAIVGYAALTRPARRLAGDA